MTVITLPHTGLISKLTVSKNGDIAPLLFTDQRQMEMARAHLANHGYGIDEFDPSLLIFNTAVSAVRHAQLYCRDR